MWRDGNYNWTDDARALSREVQDALRPILDKYVEMGYSPRDISHIMASDIQSLECYKVVMIGMNRRKAIKAGKDE
jgi:hypothetical protein